MKVVKGKETKVRYIKKIRSIQKNRKISSEQFKKEAEKLIKVNKKEYTPEFIQLVTELDNTGVISISSTAECTKIIQAFLTLKNVFQKAQYLAGIKKWQDYGFVKALTLTKDHVSSLME